MGRYGNYYGVYDMKEDERCVGIFDTSKDLAEYFGKTEHQVWQNLGRQRKAKNAGNTEQPNYLNYRYKIVRFQPPTRTEIHRAGKAKYGAAWYCNNHRKTTQGYKIRNASGEWELFAEDNEDAAEKLGLETAE